MTENTIYINCLYQGFPWQTTLEAGDLLEKQGKCAASGGRITDVRTISSLLDFRHAGLHDIQLFDAFSPAIPIPGQLPRLPAGCFPAGLPDKQGRRHLLESAS